MLKTTCNNSLDLVKSHLVLDCNQTTTSLHGKFEEEKKNMFFHSAQCAVQGSLLFPKTEFFIKGDI